MILKSVAPLIKRFNADDVISEINREKNGGIRKVLDLRPDAYDPEDQDQQRKIRSMDWEILITSSAVYVSESCYNQIELGCHLYDLGRPKIDLGLFDDDDTNKDLN